MTHNGRGYLQLELISGAEAAALWNPFLRVWWETKAITISYITHAFLHIPKFWVQFSPIPGITNSYGKLIHVDY